MDEQEVRDYQQRRETFLTLFLALFGTAGFLFFLILVTGGFFLYVLIGLTFIGVAGIFHYLLWGKLFSDHVAGEREELAAREADADLLSSRKNPARRRPH